MSREIWNFSVTNTHADTLGTIHGYLNNPWINLISEREERDRERNKALIPGFSVHMYTHAVFLTLSTTLSQNPNDFVTKRVCVSLVIRRAAAASASVYGRGSMVRRSAQIKQTSKQLLVQRCGLTSGLKTAPTACTIPPPPKPVHVDFKNACAENPPAKEEQNM
jgi:hypothetical protein